mmetsp:Transcript_71225/g.201837  ORF Transcript_71225/g.201837 Transcript_71225/m.201837 type:complete len:413 (+) Transcript_71225:284-1522(+)
MLGPPANSSAGLGRKKGSCTGVSMQCRTLCSRSSRVEQQVHRAVGAALGSRSAQHVQGAALRCVSSLKSGGRCGSMLTLTSWPSSSPPWPSVSSPLSVPLSFCPARSPPVAGRLQSPGSSTVAPQRMEIGLSCRTGGLGAAPHGRITAGLGTDPDASRTCALTSSSTSCRAAWSSVFAHCRPMALASRCESSAQSVCSSSSMGSSSQVTVLLRMALLGWSVVSTTTVRAAETRRAATSRAARPTRSACADGIRCMSWPRSLEICSPSADAPVSSSSHACQEPSISSSCWSASWAFLWRTVASSTATASFSSSQHSRRTASSPTARSSHSCLRSLRRSRSTAPRASSLSGSCAPPWSVPPEARARSAREAVPRSSRTSLAQASCCTASKARLTLTHLLLFSPSTNCVRSAVKQ